MDTSHTLAVPSFASDQPRSLRERTIPRTPVSPPGRRALPTCESGDLWTTPIPAPSHPPTRLPGLVPSGENDMTRLTPECPRKIPRKHPVPMFDEFHGPTHDVSAVRSPAAYNLINADLSKQFLLRVKQTKNSIAKNPLYFPIKSPKTMYAQLYCANFLIISTSLSMKLEIV